MKKEFIKTRVANVTNRVNLVYTVILGEVYLRAVDILAVIGYKKSSCSSVIKRRCSNVQKVYFKVDGIKFRKIQTSFLNIDDIEEVLRTTRLKLDTNHKAFLYALVDHLKQLNAQIKASVENKNPVTHVVTPIPVSKSFRVNVSNNGKASSSNIFQNEKSKLQNEISTFQNEKTIPEIITKNTSEITNNNNSCCYGNKPLRSFQKLRILANNITFAYKDYFKNNSVIPLGDFGADIVNAAMETLELKLIGNAFYNVYLEMLKSYGYDLDNVIIKGTIDNCSTKILKPIFIAMGWEYKLEYSMF